MHIWVFDQRSLTRLPTDSLSERIYTIKLLSVLCSQREQLKEEQLGHIKVLRKQAKEQESKLEQREVVNKEQVEQALQQNLELVRSQEKELAGSL